MVEHIFLPFSIEIGGKRRNKKGRREEKIDRQSRRQKTECVFEYLIPGIQLFLVRHVYCLYLLCVRAFLSDVCATSCAFCIVARCTFLTTIYFGIRPQRGRRGRATDRVAHSLGLFSFSC